jgi:hypothetical protein
MASLRTLGAAFVGVAQLQPGVTDSVLEHPGGRGGLGRALQLARRGFRPVAELVIVTLGRRQNGLL